jgi:hypothetical protein
VYDDTIPDDNRLVIDEDSSLAAENPLTSTSEDSLTYSSFASSPTTSTTNNATTTATSASTGHFSDINPIPTLRKYGFSPKGHGHQSKSPRVKFGLHNNRASASASASDKESASDRTSESVNIEYMPQKENKKEVLKDIVIFIISGILSSITYELLLKIDSGTALLSSFFLHMYIVFFSLSKAPLYLFASRIPMMKHMIIVLLSFSFIYFKSLAIPLLPMPVFIVCTNLQLVVGLLVGKFIFGKTFIKLQYVGVGLITIGCLVITLVSKSKKPAAQVDSESSSSGTDVDDSSDTGRTDMDMCLGFVYMMLSITSLSIMIPTGSKYVQTYNADVQEHIFIQHFLALPLFLMHWETKLFPILSNILSAGSTSTGDSSYEGMNSECQYPGIAIPLFGTHQIYVPIVLIFLLSTTVFAQINRYYMIEVSISMGSFMTQLIGSCNKTVVFLISSLYFNAPPYPPYAVWMGLCIQVLGSYVYVQASFSSPDSPQKGALTSESSFSFRPNTSSNRLARVSWGGDALYDSSLLGLTSEDVAYIRQATNKHNNRLATLHVTQPPHPSDSSNIRAIPPILTTDSERNHHEVPAADPAALPVQVPPPSPGDTVPLQMLRTVSEVVIKPAAERRVSENTATISIGTSDVHAPLPPPSTLRQRGKSTADIMTSS